jgi:hypothetical protein
MKTVGHKGLIAMLQRFQSRKEYTALKRSCEAAVTEWRWATSLMLPELPHDDVVCGFKPPKWAKKPPRHGSLHGLDDGGVIRCIRSDERTKPDKEVYEQFLIHEGGGFWCIYFGADAKKSLLAVKWFEMQGDRWQRSLEIGPYGVCERVLRWEADRFVQYTDRIWRKVSAGNPRAAARTKLKDNDAEQTVYSYTYAADGELDRVTVGPDPEEVKYQRVPKGANLKSLLQEAEDMLVAEIPRTLRAAKVRETVYSLLLQFTGVDTDLGGFAPPMLLPTENLRRRLLEEHPKDVPSYFWAAVEWQGDPDVVELACKNPALDEKLHLIFQLTVVQPSPSNYGPVRKMFQRVCARLNALDWNGILKTTDDFIVIPFDPHGEMEPNVDLKASVPAEKLRLLMDRGRLWRFKVK